MPAPSISSHPLPPHTLHPFPLQRLQEISTSALGSVKGKKEGLRRILVSGPKYVLAKRESTPLRCPKFTPSHAVLPLTISPSIWWNMKECRASTVSGLNTLPGAIILMGGFCFCITLICTVEVWLLRRTSSET